MALCLTVYLVDEDAANLLFQELPIGDVGHRFSLLGRRTLAFVRLHVLELQQHLLLEGDQVVAAFFFGTELTWIAIHSGRAWHPQLDRLFFLHAAVQLASTRLG